VLAARLALNVGRLALIVVEKSAKAVVGWVAPAEGPNDE